MKVLVFAFATVLGTIQVRVHSQCPFTRRVERDLRNIITVAEAIYTDTGRYPKSIDEMVGFKNEDGSPRMAFCESYPRDPWGREYLYQITPDGRPSVACLGSDNRPGGEGEAADTVVRGSP